MHTPSDNSDREKISARPGSTPPPRTNRTGPGTLVAGILCGSLAFCFSSCSEQVQKAVEVLKEKAEKKVVEAAGEAEVAMKLLRQQYADLKEQFVRIRTLRTGFERKAGEAQKNAERLRKEGKEPEAVIHEHRQQLYAEKLEFLKQRETQAESALREFAAAYEEQKANIELLQEETEVYRTSSGVAGEDEITGKLGQRRESIQKLSREIQQKADRAKAIFDVGEIEKSF